MACWLVSTIDVFYVQMAERFQKDGAQGFHSGGPEPHHQYQEYHQPSSCRKHNEEKQQPMIRENNNKNKTKPKTSHSWPITLHRSWGHTMHTRESLVSRKKCNFNQLLIKALKANRVIRFPKPVKNSWYQSTSKPDLQRWKLRNTLSGLKRVSGSCMGGFRLFWLMSATVLCLLVFADAVKQGAMLMYPLETYGLVMQATPPSVPNRGYCKLNISYRLT